MIHKTKESWLHLILQQNIGTIPFRSECIFDNKDNWTSVDNLYFRRKNSLISKDRSALQKVGKTVPGWLPIGDAPEAPIVDLPQLLQPQHQLLLALSEHHHSSPYKKFFMFTLLWPLFSSWVFKNLWWMVSSSYTVGGLFQEICCLQEENSTSITQSNWRSPSTMLWSVILPIVTLNDSEQ